MAGNTISPEMPVYHADIIDEGVVSVTPGDGWLLKLDAEGDIEWQKCYRGGY